MISNLGLLGLNTVVGLWLTPYLIKHLGVAAYGLVPLANSTVMYMSVINSALNSAVGRYLTIDIRKGSAEVANQTFNTALGGSAGLAIALLPIALGVSVVAPSLFNIPAGQEQAVRWLFGAIMVAYLLGVVQSVFTVSAFAQNRFDWLNSISASQVLVRVVTIVLLFSLLVPQVWQVGAGTLLGTLLSFAFAVVVWRRLTPGLSIDPHAFDRSRLRKLFAMGGWMTVNQVGALLFLQLDLIIVNLILGAEVGGLYGSVLQWSILLRAVARTVAGVLTPIVLAQYARGDLDGITRLSQQAIKLLGLGMALPVGIVCGLSKPLLGVWLGPEFTDLATLMSVMLAHLSLNLSVLPLFAIQVTLNKVKWPGTVTLVTGMVNLGLAVWWADWGAYGLGVALAGAVVLTLKNTVFTPIYGARIQGLRWDRYLSSMIPGVVGAICTGVSAYALAQVFALNTWVSIGVTTAGIAGIYAALAYFVGLSHADRRLLLSFVPWRRG